MSKIIIKRLHNICDSQRDYNIYIDGKKIGKIAEEEVLEFDLPEGKHQIYVGMDIFFSDKLDFELNNNNITFVTVSNFNCYKMLSVLLFGLGLPIFINFDDHFLSHLIKAITSFLLMIVAIKLWDLYSRYINLRIEKD